MLSGIRMRNRPAPGIQWSNRSFKAGGGWMRFPRVWVMTLSLALTTSLAEAQETKEFSRIARLSYVEGHVSFQYSNAVDCTAASINLALQSGDRIYTGDDGRAEIEFDDGSVLRLAEK